MNAADILLKCRVFTKVPTSKTKQMGSDQTSSNMFPNSCINVRQSVAASPILAMRRTGSQGTTQETSSWRIRVKVLVRVRVRKEGVKDGD